jgi:hypothetical protein
MAPEIQADLSSNNSTSSTAHSRLSSLLDSRSVVTPRGGIPRFLRKADKKERLTIGFLGASITGVRGWRNRTFGMICRRFPQCTFSELNAARGAESILSALHRIQSDVVPAQPDLLFLEYTPISRRVAESQAAAALESIIRHVRAELSECDIVLVHAIDRHLLDESLKTQEIPSILRRFETVAAYYEIPSVDVFSAVAKRYLAGDLIFDRGHYLELIKSGVPPETLKTRIHFTLDGGHPLWGSGDLLYLAALTEAFDRLNGHVGPAEKPSIPAEPLEQNTSKSLTEIAETNLPDIRSFGPLHGVHGSIPSFARFRELQILRLSENDLQGTLEAISENTKLTFLECSKCGLEGTLSPVAGLPDIRELNLNHNRFTGGLSPLQSLERLFRVTLARNELEGPFVPFDSSPDLRLIDVGRNRLCGPIPEFTANSDLRFLFCEHNQLEGSLPRFRANPELRTISCAGNALSGDLHTIRDLPNLTKLLCKDNKLGGELPPFEGCQLLGHIDLTGNRFEGYFPHLAHTMVVALHLAGNLLEAYHPGSLRIPTLTDLDISENPMTASAISALLSDLLMLAPQPDAEMRRLIMKRLPGLESGHAHQLAALRERGWYVATH